MVCPITQGDHKNQEQYWSQDGTLRDTTQYQNPLRQSSCTELSSKLFETTKTVGKLYSLLSLLEIWVVRFLVQQPYEDAA